ncbi:MAG TPA: hydrogenase maturation nickel metallochaperone HypA [Chloroflexota bacterium]|nr:hydrogenase maturation nickel metallochaperone HypA [Chloroflexota bacterium]
MHEATLVRGLTRTIDALAREHQARRVVRVKVSLGALSHLSPEHFREHFTLAAIGTLAESAHLDIETASDVDDPHAQDIVLRGIDVEVGP